MQSEACAGPLEKLPAANVWKALDNRFTSLVKLWVVLELFRKKFGVWYQIYTTLEYDWPTTRHYAKEPRPPDIPKGEERRAT